MHAKEVTYEKALVYGLSIYQAPRIQHFIRPTEMAASRGATNHDGRGPEW